MTHKRGATREPVPEVSAEDAAWLERARALGRRGWGHVHPNPMVGCVLVRNGEVAGEGWHEVFGGPHAEVVALRAAGEHARGATAYVSLEPCDHHGKTPPCTEALVAAGVERVVFGARDPGHESGGGAETLRRAGLVVDGPVWPGRVARAENPAFFHAHGAERETPFLALKLAISLDGRISAAAGRRTRVSGPDAEREAHRLRTGFDALLVGAGTLRADDPRLTVRAAPPGRKAPQRVLLVSDGAVPEDAAVLREAPTVPVHVFTSDRPKHGARSRLERAGAQVHPVGEGPSGLDLRAVLARCAELGIGSILCEGGARLAASLLREELVRRVYLFVAPVTFGRAGVPAFPDDAERICWDRFERVLEPEAHGRDTLIVLDRGDVAGEATDPLADPAGEATDSLAASPGEATDPLADPAGEATDALAAPPGEATAGD